MNRELALSGAALAVAIVALATLALSGAVADPAAPDTEAEIDGHASLLEVTIAADDVSGDTVTLEIDSHLEQHGGPVENVTVVHRATDTDTGLVEDTTEREVGTLEGGGETAATAGIDIPRDGSYEIETFVSVDDMRVDSTTHRLSGVDALTPAYADTGLEFHRFSGQEGVLSDVPAIEYSVVETDEEAGDATLEVTAYLTNAGDDAADGLEVELKLRQTDSNVVADDEMVPVGPVEPGDTATPSAELKAADEYAYYLDAVLWHDGTIVATDRAVADLDPDADAAAFETTDFEDAEESFETVEADADDAAPADGDRAMDDSPDSDQPGDEMPGFGVVVAGFTLVASLAAFARYRRYRARSDHS